MIKKPYINDDFLLTNPTARYLYHQYAKGLPVIDFHNHLPVKDMVDDRIFGNISTIWLEGDHYKWRAMRACGIDEYYITGAASDWEKFEKWAQTVPYLIRNPLYHWTHLELKRYFHIDELLDQRHAATIYDRCNEKLATADYSTRNLLRKANIEYLCTTEDPMTDLSWHQQLQADFEIGVSAAFRCDPILNIHEIGSFYRYVEALQHKVDCEIETFDQLCQVLERRHHDFHQFGCRLADFALDWFVFAEADSLTVNRIFGAARAGQSITRQEVNIFRTAILSFLCELNHVHSWAQQFHLGALRDVNLRGVNQVGQACGFDAINDVTYIAELGKFLNAMEQRQSLAKSIFFNLNPRDGSALAALVNTFNDGSIQGKMQYGPAWWFLDQKNGIEMQLNDFSIYGALGTFIGMLTDSRSFLSFTRHEYFRRILCNMLGSEMEAGLLPDEKSLLGETVENICYHNVKKYLEV